LGVKKLFVDSCAWHPHGTCGLWIIFAFRSIPDATFAVHEHGSIKSKFVTAPELSKEKYSAKEAMTLLAG
jgi:hypothetical protein